VPRWLIFLSGSERQVLSYPDNSILEIHIQGGGLSVYLDDWLILAKLDTHRLCSSAIRKASDNTAKSSLSSIQRISFLGGVLDLAQMGAPLMPELALTIQWLTASFKVWVLKPLRKFQGCWASWPLWHQLGLLQLPLGQLEKNCLLEKTALYQLPGNPQNLPARSEKAACLSPVIHFGSSVQHKPPRWTQIKASVQTGETALWPFPLRKDLISQVKGTIWHP